MSIRISGQTTFDQFMTIKNKKRTYFYIDWSKKDYNAMWLTDRPIQVNYEVEVKWKELGYPITVCCYNQEPIYEKPKEVQYKNVSLMKSHLQKCVRRQLADKSIKTAWHLIKMDLDSFIRRLPIIMLEDVKLHQSFSVLIWLMSAVSKGYCPTQSQMKWILGVVSYLCSENQYDNYNCMQSKIKNIPEMIKKIDKLNQISQDQRDVLYSLLFRLSYGGMKGDMNMVYDFVESYIVRFEKGEKLDRSEIVPIEIDDIDELDISHFELVAVDFHCFPRLLNMVQNKYPDYSIEDLRKCIWEYNSKYNSRKHDNDKVNDTDLYSIWLRIKSYVSVLQDQLIESNH